MWPMRNLVIFVVLNLFCIVVYTAETTASVEQVATNDLPSCNEKDENINACLLKVFQYMIPRSKDGIPELNIPPMDPFVINRTSYIFSHPIFDGKLSVRNMKIHGLSKIKTSQVNYKRDGKHSSMQAQSFVPKMFVEGTYKAKIRINTANISSRGPFNVTLTNINVTTDGSANLIRNEKDGHLYMHFTSVNVDPNIGNMVFLADGLMPEPLLNDAILEFVNQNWRSIYKTILPETRAAWEPEIVKLGNEYFSHIPVDTFLKE